MQLRSARNLRRENAIHLGIGLTFLSDWSIFGDGFDLTTGGSHPVNHVAGDKMGMDK